MPGRQVLSRGVRPGASWQLGMIRRILEFCHWSPWCSPRRPRCLVVTATIATLNLLTGRNSSRPWWLGSPKQQALWGVRKPHQGTRNWTTDGQTKSFAAPSPLVSTYTLQVAFYSLPFVLFMVSWWSLAAFCKIVRPTNWILATAMIHRSKSWDLN